MELVLVGDGLDFFVGEIFGDEIDVVWGGLGCVVGVLDEGEGRPFGMVLPEV